MLKKSKLDQGEILGMSLCGSVPAEKLGHCQFFCVKFFNTLETFLKLFSTVESFDCLGQINHTSTDCLQLRWPLCVSERVCTFFLQLFTQLEDKHCTLPTKVCLKYVYTVSDWISALNFSTVIATDTCLLAKILNKDATLYIACDG